MSNYHIIIQQERRTPIITERKHYPDGYVDTVDADGCTVQVPRNPENVEVYQDVNSSRLAIPITSTLPTEQPDTYLAGETMLHSYTAADMSRTVGEGADAQKLPPDFSDPQFVMVAEWDGTSPYVIQHKGDYAVRNMEYSGWPAITKEQWEGAQQVMEGRT